MDDKRDWLIAIVVFIILAFFFSMQSILPNNDEQYDKDGATIGNGAQIAGDEGNLVFEYGENMITKPSKDSNKSPETGCF